MGKLDGQVALITGGTKGIGEAAVRLFVQEGPAWCSVAVRDRTESVSPQS